MICWLALLLVRVAESCTGETWRRLQRQLDRMQLGEFSGHAGRVLRRTESTPYQLTMFKALGISQPPQFHLAEATAPART